MNVQPREAGRRLFRYLWGACSSCWPEWSLGRAAGCWRAWVPDYCSSRFDSGARWRAGSPAPCAPPPEDGRLPSHCARSPPVQEVEDFILQAAASVIRSWRLKQKSCLTDTDLTFPSFGINACILRWGQTPIAKFVNTQASFFDTLRTSHKLQCSPFFKSIHHLLTKLSHSKWLTGEVPFSKYEPQWLNCRYFYSLTRQNHMTRGYGENRSCKGNTTLSGWWTIRSNTETTHTEHFQKDLYCMNEYRWAIVSQQNMLDCCEVFKCLQISHIFLKEVVEHICR